MLRQKAAFVVLLSVLLPPAGFVRAQVPGAEPVGGLRFTLRAAPREEPKPADSPVQIENLSQSDTDAIFRRLPPMEASPSDKTGFALRDESLPPPNTGRRIPVDFNPRPDRKPVSSPAPVEIIRAVPNGRTSPATDLSITFSQPMIALSDQKAAAANVPVKLTPEIPGKWRWLGTRTIVFRPEKRFRAATRFTVTIPAGTRSAAGGATADDFKLEFETPAPEVSAFLPVQKTDSLLPVMLAEFNQRIDPAVMIESLKARSGDREIPVRIASADEIEKDEAVKRRVALAPVGSWLAFVPIEKLPVDSGIEVVFPAGIRAAEGDIASAIEKRFGFRTFGPLEFDRIGCGWDGAFGPCESDADPTLRFTQEIDERKFRPSMIRIEPRVANPEFEVNGDEIRLRNYFEPNRKYKVTLSENLTDIHGQRLGEKATAEFSVLPENRRVMLLGSQSSYLTLDPFAPPVYSLGSVNVRRLRVRIFQMKPQEFAIFREFESDSENSNFPDIGKLVSDRVLKVGGDVNEGRMTRVNLAPFLKSAYGFLVLVAEPADGGAVPNEDRVFVWIQSTRIALDSFIDAEGITIFANDLGTGKPLENVEIELEAASPVKTGSDGLVTLRWPSRLAAQGTLMARLGDDRSFVPGIDTYDLAQLQQKETHRWFVFDDRGMYRPGETVSLKGYVRRVSSGKSPDIAEFGAGPRGFSYKVTDSRSTRVAQGRGELNLFGAFDLKIDLPNNINLGGASVELKLDDGAVAHRHGVKVQEFRRPEFEVSAETESRGPNFAGEPVTFGARAKYFSGGGLRAASVNWRVSSMRTNYSPPDRDQYVFGNESEWHDEPLFYQKPPDLVRELKAETDDEGRHRIVLDADAVSEPVPSEVTAEARVTDVNRQTFAGKTTTLIHPANVYIGLRTETNFVAAGEKIEVHALVTDVDGATVSGREFEIKIEFYEWRRVDGDWERIVRSTDRCARTSQTVGTACAITAEGAGPARITAVVTDDRGRRNRTIMETWVAGIATRPSDELEEDEVEVVVNRDEYRPGDVAEVLVNSPIYPAEGVMMIKRFGIVRTERFSLTSPTAILKVPIDESMLPSATVSVAVFGSAKRTYEDERLAAKLPPRPAFATGAARLRVSTESRRLTVIATPQNGILEPGEKTRVDLEVLDHLGRPAVNAEVALVAADESVLALSGYRINDPVDSLYAEFSGGDEEYYPRLGVELADSDEILAALGLIKDLPKSFGFGSGSGHGDGEGSAKVVNDRGVISFGQYDLKNNREVPVGLLTESNGASMIRIRRNFDALAAFAPSVRTDTNGRAVVNVDLPDNLTRYRITAVATDGAKRFGKTESSITARQRLMVRPSAPRFMNFGDRAEIPVVIHNDSGRDRSVNVAIRASNALLKNGTGRMVTIGAGNRAEIRFPVEAESAGIARFQVGVVADELADAAEFAFPVLTPANVEQFATYGSITDENPVSYEIKRPENVHPQFGGLEVAVSSTQLQELTDAVLYLQRYPFECGEQTASRILAMAALRNVLSAFDAREMPSETEIAKRMAADFENLKKIQRADGGFGFWAGTGDSDPFVSVHVAHSLERARLAGFSPPPEMLSRVRVFLKNIDTKIPAYYPPQSRASILAYALAARAAGGDRDHEKARRILRSETIERHSSETLGWLLDVLADDRAARDEIADITRAILGRAKESAEAASISSGFRYKEFVTLQSDRRTDAVVLSALVGIAGENSAVADLIPKLVRGLLGGRGQGRWSNTQENVFAALALERYFKVFEKESTDFTARIWIGDVLARESEFNSRSTATETLKIPMDYLLGPAKNGELTMLKNGAGRMYYRVAYKSAPREAKTEAFDNGFDVVRSFEAVDDPGDVKISEDGSITVRAGARVKIRLEIYSRDVRYHVALVDRLAAGFEVINQELAVSESMPGTNPKDSLISDWWSHRNIRDDRVEIFANRLPGGVRYYEYFVRATAPGVFVAPSAKAEEMYSPETYGRSRSELVTIR